jgi:DNA polymerase elongation subunit (family B)
MHTSDGELHLLYGADEAPGLVGVGAALDGVRCWWRRDGSTGDGGAGAPGAGTLAAETVPFQPFFLISHPELLDAFRPAPQIATLTGGNLYRYRVNCESWAQHDEALAHVGRLYRAQRASFAEEPLLAIREPAVQYLLHSGRTHYKGLRLDGLSTLFIALRAYNGNGADYADPQEEGDRVVMVGLADGHNWLRLFEFEGDERRLLSQVAEALLERDPDVIVGHDLFKGALSYFAARAKRLRVKLNWGRDGTPLRLRTSRAPAAEKQLEYPRADAAGRSFVDTWFLTAYYDIVKRDLERFDAPFVARYLDRTCQLPDPVPAWDVEQLFDGKRALLAADVQYELEAAQIIYNTLAGSYFAQAQMLPFSLQDSVVRGNATKINYLLLREYLRRGESIPAPVETRTFIGGYTELRRTGLIRDVLNVDIASLYPSIMLRHGVQPRNDTGGVFQPLLAELTRQRLAAKHEARTATGPAARTLADARQAAFKIFINSFFGYLGTGRMNWADPDKGEYVTTTGQGLVKHLAQIVEAEGGSVVEIDTDGVYFTAPVGCVSEEGREALAARINARLGEAPGGAGISAEIGAYYPAMLSYRVKNYALLGEDGSITLKGSGMKSRGLEPFLREFIEQGTGDILRGEPERIMRRYEDLHLRISQRALDIRQVAKTDTLIESLESYKAKVAKGGAGGGGRNRAAAYEMALQAKRPLRPGDQVSYYITGEKHTVKAFEAAKPLRAYDPANPDYNVAYYVKKLDENLKKVQAYMEPGDAPADGGAPEGDGLFGGEG